jgi:hypothetical protein
MASHDQPEQRRATNGPKAANAINWRGCALAAPI